MINILIADDHALIREGFKKIIGGEVDMKVAGEAGNAAEIFSFLRNSSCDVLALDIDMPDRSGLDIIKDVQNIAPGVKIIMLSIHPEERFAIRALKAGALAYVTKESAPEELVKTIRKVIGGRQYISESLGEQLALNLVGKKKKAPHESLSDREFQVLYLIGTGKTVTQIAGELSLSISTVNTYRLRILEKLNISSNAGLIHYVLKNNLAD